MRKQHPYGSRQKIGIHSYGLNPKTPDDVFIHYTEKARQLELLVKPCIERSLEKYQQANMAEMISEYMGRQIIVVTSKIDGRINLFACTAEDLELPEFAELKNKIDERWKTNPPEIKQWQAELNPDETFFDKNPIAKDGQHKHGKKS